MCVAWPWHKLNKPDAHFLLMGMASLGSALRSWVCHQDTLCHQHLVKCSSLLYNCFIIPGRQNIIVRINVKLYISENKFLSKTGEKAKFDWSPLNNIFVLQLLLLLTLNFFHFTESPWLFKLVRVLNCSALSRLLSFSITQVQKSFLPRFLFIWSLPSNQIWNYHTA